MFKITLAIFKITQAISNFTQAISEIRQAIFNFTQAINEVYMNYLAIIAFLIQNLANHENDSHKLLIISNHTFQIKGASKK